MTLEAFYLVTTWDPWISSDGTFKKYFLKILKINLKI